MGLFVCDFLGAFFLSAYKSDCFVANDSYNVCVCLRSKFNYFSSDFKIASPTIMDLSRSLCVDECLQYKRCGLEANTCLCVCVRALK